VPPGREISEFITITILTHCIDFFVSAADMNDIVLVLGKHDFSVDDEPHGNVTRKVQSVVIHPNYDSYTTHNDLALLRFDKPVKFQPNVLPVCIPEDDSDFSGFNAFITGWGASYYGKNFKNNI